MNHITNSTAACIECHADIVTPNDVLAGEVLPCDECGVDLEVTQLDPIELQLAPEIEEDWGE